MCLHIISVSVSTSIFKINQSIFELLLEFYNMWFPALYITEEEEIYGVELKSWDGSRYQFLSTVAERLQTLILI